MKEKKLRIEDSLAAAKAAVEEGIVAGGGVALINAIPAVERQIAFNSGLEGSVIIDAIRRSGKVGYGFDFAKDEYVDMLPAGILDPTKVTRSALENAASVASMVLTTESLVADKKEPTPPAAPAPDMGGMY